MASINKEQAGVGLSKFIFLIRKYSKSAELFYVVARVYFEIKSESISVSGGFAKLKEILIENTIILDGHFLDLKANSHSKLQADDVLATAGINPDEESSFLVQLQQNSQHFSVKDTEFKQHKDYFRVRHVIASRVKENICIQNPKAEWVINDAMHNHLKTLIVTLVTQARKRRIGSQHLLASFLKSKDSPKSLVRVTNSQKEVNKKKREESERKVLLKVGEALTKRKKDMSTEFSSMEQKVAKVLQQEEDRVQAHAANQATRTAFGGDAKYMKWQDKVQEQNLISIKSKDKDNFVRDTVHPPNFGTDTSNVSICMRDLLLVFKQNKKKMTKSYHGFTLTD
jgi:hypothetical protein